jgi:hypothetical protein
MTELLYAPSTSTAKKPKKMNAISVTMARGADTRFLQGYAFRLTVAMVMLSWAGWQALLISGAEHEHGATGHTLFFFYGGLTLLLYSLFLLLQMKRKEATPSRESAQLFFSLFLIWLPLMTWLVWRHLRPLLADHRQLHAGNGAGEVLVYSCVLISLTYFLVILAWLQTTVSSYESARPGSWPYRIVHWVQSSVIAPYAKK